MQNDPHNPHGMRWFQQRIADTFNRGGQSEDMLVMEYRILLQTLDQDVRRHVKSAV